MVKESLDSIYRNAALYEAEEKKKNTRKIVIDWLKNPKTNCAEIMRELWHPTKEEEDAKRSFFYKCRDGKLNDAGVPYRFSDKEINRLNSIRSK